MSLLFAGVLCADPAAEVPAAEGVHAKVDALMKAQRADEAVVLLEAALKDHPDDVEALRKLGSIYAMVLRQPEKGALLLEKGAKTGDKKSLQALALTQLSMQDDKGMLAYKKLYVDNYENLGGARVVCFYIAGQERDGGLFNQLLLKTPWDDIEKDKNLSMMIAKTAKRLVENDRVEGADAPEGKADGEGK
ncbi:tetratricopeptide repeat protein [Luteolibacter sp. Y139]|uniref:Tetratricopeptide repeat protein n=1 Tax=Luteolibacter soli TaxID=3135280 RepID=A0ABU9AYV0_9BACT